MAEPPGLRRTDSVPREDLCRWMANPAHPHLFFWWPQRRPSCGRPKTTTEKSPHPEIGTDPRSQHSHRYPPMVGGHLQGPVHDESRHQGWVPRWGSRYQGSLCSVSRTGGAIRPHPEIGTGPRLVGAHVRGRCIRKEKAPTPQYGGKGESAPRRQGGTRYPGKSMFGIPYRVSWCPHGCPQMPPS